MELEERKRPPLSPDFIRQWRYKSENLETTAAVSPKFPRNDTMIPSHSNPYNRKNYIQMTIKNFKMNICKRLSL